MSTDGLRVDVANAAANSVSVIDAGTNTIIETITAGTGSLGLSVSVDGSRVYVASRISNDVSVIDTGTCVFQGNPAHSNDSLPPF